MEADILKGWAAIPDEIQKSFQTMSDNFEAHPPAFLTASFWSDIWAGIKAGATDAANWIANAYNTASAAVSSALKSFPGDPSIPAMPMASGGYIRGAGTGTSDSIMARLSNGAFVMRAAAVDRWGPRFMHVLNCCKTRSALAAAGWCARCRAAGGGMVSATTSGGVTVRHFPGGSYQMRADKRSSPA
jgi:hypothetical protein